MQILISFDVVQLEGRDARYIIRQPGHSININRDEAEYVLKWLQILLTQDAPDLGESAASDGESTPAPKRVI